MNMMNVTNVIADVSNAGNLKVANNGSEGKAHRFKAFLQSQEQDVFQTNTSNASGDDSSFNNVNLGTEDELSSLSDVAPDVNEQFLLEDNAQLQLISQILNGQLTSLEGLELDAELASNLSQLLQMVNLSDYHLSPEIVEQLELLLQIDLNSEASEEIQVSVNDSIYQEMIQLFGEISRLLNNPDDILQKEQASQLLALLRQWSALNGQAEKGEVERLMNNELSEKDATIWKQLVNVFEKRSFFTENNIYRSNSDVTRTDVMNWLQQAFSNYEAQAEKVTAPIVTQQQIPMTEVQQYTIHVNSLNRVERVSEEVMTKFENIIRESRFMTNHNMKELTINLRPDNLGNMIVRFTQIDGEMAVKIIVSSLAAKNMLEANVHQLKHMFSPHQVVIERNESISDEEFFHEEEQEQNEEETLEEERESNENQDENRPEIDFQSLFQQVSEEEIADD